ncbi:serine hydrolase [Alkalibacterium olivapovliticus]|uniref:serine-type D-Ala-D-Ala carboxypeptidase n=1 Tax=Alkalibacterium olivapovliticus TaxID=99907 RepID=A0A2T0W095_9LACT|nr:serine hydrolase [Alkalibacterium olivapovliticus]PRY78038.1 D-alanyl-D-alanine carboxypeptidase (penicillin-binding protein 5/6) [Alkalibacterium olivapovliticus]
MMIDWKKGLTTSFIAALTVPLAGAYTVSAEEADLSVEAESALLIDFETSQVLYNQNAEDQRGIASMTKMLVEYILFEEIEAGNLNWDDEVTISDYAHAISQNYALSNVPLQQGGTYTVQELYEALAIYSANGATIALAEEMEGSEAEFVDRMRDLVESWGVEEYQLYNTTGLNNSFLEGNHYPGSDEDAENIMSAKGIATVSQQLISDYPEVLETSSIPTKTFREGTSDAINMLNWNWMLEGMTHERMDVDGLKTGTTSFAGATFTGTAESEGRRLVSVVMGAGDGFTNRGQRFEETSKLFDYGFGAFEYATIIEAEMDMDEEYNIAVRNGVEEEVSLVTTESIAFYLPEGSDIADYSYTFVPNEEVVNQNGEVEAPISVGENLGQLVVENTEDLEFLDGEAPDSVNVAAAQSIERANVFTVFSTWLREFFNGVRDRF